MFIDVRDEWKAKNKYLMSLFPYVTPTEFYDDVFGGAEFERRGHEEDSLPNGILTDIEMVWDEKTRKMKKKDRGKNHLVFDGLQELSSGYHKAFALLSPIGYFGSKPTKKNMSVMYALVIDVDGTDLHALKYYLLPQIDEDLTDYVPRPTYIVNSGHGFHLYYVFEEPVKMYKAVQERLQEIRDEIASRLWKRGACGSLDPDKPQLLSISQRYRMVGSSSKLGKKFPVVAFRCGDRTTVSHMEYVLGMDDVFSSLYHEDSTPIDTAKELWPEWYRKRIVEKQVPGSWVCNTAVYDWFYDLISHDFSEGHRYYNIYCLASYAVKCGVPFERLKKDALSLVPMYDAVSSGEDNRFTKNDALCAVRIYHEPEKAVRLSIKTISRLTGIRIRKNKRNGLTRKENLDNARRIQQEKDPDGSWRNKKGAPTKEALVREYFAENPGASLSEAAASLGMSKTTVCKWRKVMLSETVPAEEKAAETMPSGTVSVYGTDASSCDIIPVLDVFETAKMADPGFEAKPMREDPVHTDVPYRIRDPA